MARVVGDPALNRKLARNWRVQRDVRDYMARSGFDLLDAIHRVSANRRLAEAGVWPRSVVTRTFGGDVVHERAARRG